MSSSVALLCESHEALIFGRYRLREPTNIVILLRIFHTYNLKRITKALLSVQKT